MPLYFGHLWGRWHKGRIGVWWGDFGRLDGNFPCTTVLLSSFFYKWPQHVLVCLGVCMMLCVSATLVFHPQYPHPCCLLHYIRPQLPVFSFDSLSFLWATLTHFLTVIPHSVHIPEVHRHSVLNSIGHWMPKSYNANEAPWQWAGFRDRHKKPPFESLITSRAKLLLHDVLRWRYVGTMP